jgi:radical SAM protein with 4Fe4S-binding SPASM domain
MGTYSRTGSHRVGRRDDFFVEHGYLRVPSLVQWMATLRCGLSCAHCLAVSREGGFSDMPIEKVRTLIDEVARMGVREFLITGGEPLVREDLGEVIEYLGCKGIHWTLNTAALPSQRQREIIFRNRPDFVAVSLDGPRQVHDEFRGRTGAWDEATEAIRYFKSLGGVQVCAGTTVTSRNYNYLDETFHLVAASGADQWGLHLLVPEGRAADRPDLFLSKTQLKRLIKFVARKRQYFHVQMADEIGYLGYLEPLVRDVPLTCGAGRAQCVVLPDGEVVPCTTLDRSCSAGNIHERSLEQIWTEGFRGLRAWRPRGKCTACEYAVGCKGGCWLQRKAGTECFKNVWHVPGALKTAAGIAICLGGLATQADGKATDMNEGVICSDVTAPSYVADTEQSWTLDDAIDSWYIEQGAGLFPGSLTPYPVNFDANDVGWAFFTDFKKGGLPADVNERCLRVCAALETQERSLSLVALLWRAVSEPLFDPNAVPVSSQSERQVIRDTLAAIDLRAQQWRLEIFEGYLDPYLSNGRQADQPVFIVSKAGGRVWRDVVKYALPKDLNEERWGVGENPDTREAAEAYLLDHAYADQMDLHFAFSGTGSLTKFSGGQSELIASHVGNVSTGAHTMRVFDVFATDAAVSLLFVIESDLRRTGNPDDYSEQDLLDDQSGYDDISKTVRVTLAAGREYTYVELLNEIYYQQNRGAWVSRETLLSMAYDWLLSDVVSVWDQNVDVVAAVHQNGTLLWPAFREIAAPPETDPVSRSRRVSGTADTTLTDAEKLQAQSRAKLKEIDFWMF